MFITIPKYRAQKYTDLLSDETTNRAILKWLKMWQTCVFKIKRKVKKNQDGKLQESFGRKFGGDGHVMSLMNGFDAGSEFARKCYRAASLGWKLHLVTLH